MISLLVAGALSLLLVAQEESEEPKPEPETTEESAPEEEAPREDDAAAKEAAAAEEAAARAAAETEAAKKRIESLEFQVAAWKAIMATAPMIDKCTNRYTEEFPDRRGTVSIQFEIPGDGKVKSAKATSGLQASQNLQGCLRDVARNWRLPPVAPLKVNTTLEVQVAKGQRFFMRKPGEKEDDAPKAAQQDEGFIRFLPAQDWQ